MKIINLILATILVSGNCLGQAIENDLGKISLNVILPENKGIPEEAKQLLETKLKQIITQNGIADDGLSERFVMTAKTSIIQKDIAPSNPPRISQKIEVTFMVGDVMENKIYETTSLTLSGIGTNETKAFIAALQNIKPDNRIFAEMISKAKEKIVQHYRTNCDKYFQRAKILETNQQFDEAIYVLMQVPDVSAECRNKAQVRADELLIKKINFELEALRKQEQAISEVKARELRDYEFMLKQYEDDQKLTKQRIEAARRIAMEFAKNQPKEINTTEIITLW